MILRKIVSKIPFSELIILLGVLVLVNNYLKEEEKVIRSDGKGYYDYLPGIFIYKDIAFNYYKDVDLKLYNKDESNGLIKEFKGKRVSKYPIGNAILWSPFFAYSHLVAKSSNNYLANGYSRPYQRGIYFAALFYLFLGLVFLRKLLLYYNLSRIPIFLVQAIIVFGTPLIHYTYFDASFSHVYSFFAITLFLYLVKHYLNNNNIKTLFLAGLVFGLVFLLRQVNILVILFVPFLVGEFNRVKIFFRKHFYTSPFRLVIFIIAFFLVTSIQLIFNKFQSGYFFVYSYGDEGFNFLSPMFYESWFGFGKGLFIYTPIAFLGVLGIIFYGIKLKKSWFILSYILFLVVVNYIFSSWWCWFYGGAFGLRPWVDFLSIFAIGILFAMKTKYLKFLLIPLVPFFIYLNIIQTYQYKNYILPWGVIGYENYSTVFLQTNPMYTGYLFRDNIDINNYDKLSSFQENKDITIKKHTEKMVMQVTDTAQHYNKLKLARIWLPDNLNPNDKVVLSILSNKGEVIYYYSPWYFHAFKSEEGLNKVYLDYRFEDEIFKDNQPLSFEIRLQTKFKELKTNTIKLELFKLKDD